MKHKRLKLLMVVCFGAMLALGAFACGKDKDDTATDNETSNFYYIATDTTYEITGLIDKTVSTVVIPDGVTSIGENAFQDCVNVTSIIIPDSVTSIGENAFSGCISLTYNVKDGLKYLGNAANPYLYLAATESTDIVTVSIDNGCRMIGYAAFQDCVNVTSIIIPDSVTSVGNAAFYGCDRLTYNVKDGLKYLGNESNPYVYLAAAESTDIVTAIVDSSCRIIGYSAFSYCVGLTGVTIGNNVTSIGNAAFAACKSLTSIAIPDSVTSIGAHTFYNCSKLTGITIPDGVTSIGDYAFDSCGKLASIVIPDSVTSIGYRAFHKCEKLSSVVIPESVTYIAMDAFRHCSNLKIYCAATGQPNGWESYWYSACPVYWYSETQPTADGEYWHYVDGEPTKWEMLLEKLAIQYTDQAALDLTISGLGLDGAVVSAQTVTGVDLTIADGVIELVDLGSGDNEFVIKTATTGYSLTVFKYTKTISTMQDYYEYLAGGYAAGGSFQYAVLTQDIDATGWTNETIKETIEAQNITWTDNEQSVVIANDGLGWHWFGNTAIDGRGYVIKNFFAWGMFGPAMSGVTIRNIGLEYDQWIMSNQYQDGVFGRETSNVTLENVWINMRVPAQQVNQYGVWSVFGWKVGECTLKNVVVNVEVIGELTGTIQIDPTNESGANTVKNVYVICNDATITAGTANGWQKVKIISNPSQITNIGGSFEAKTDGLYYSGTKVL